MTCFSGLGQVRRGGQNSDVMHNTRVFLHRVCLQVYKAMFADYRSFLSHFTPCMACGCVAALQQPGGFKPCKLFSIDRVFRNESLDATHLAEFHQVEGVVADYGLGLGDLIGVITEFFSRVGTPQPSSGTICNERGLCACVFGRLSVCLFYCFTALLLLHSTR